MSAIPDRWARCRCGGIVPLREVLAYSCCERYMTSWWAEHLVAPGHQSTLVRREFLEALRRQRVRRNGAAFQEPKRPLRRTRRKEMAR